MRFKGDISGYPQAAESPSGSARSLALAVAYMLNLAYTGVSMPGPTESSEPKPVRWIGSSREDLRGFPEDVRNRVGGALWEAQLGRKATFAKPLKGFGGAGVLEVVDDFDGDTYRAIYTVRFAGVVYVLHAFQKKSTRGIATPRHEINLIEERFRRAKEDHQAWLSVQRKNRE